MKRMRLHSKEALRSRAAVLVLATCAYAGAAGANQAAPTATSAPGAAPTGASNLGNTPPAKGQPMRATPPGGETAAPASSAAQAQAPAASSDAANSRANRQGALNADEEAVLSAYRKARTALKEAEDATRAATARGSKELNAAAEAKQAEAKKAFATAREVVATTGVRLREAALAALTPELRAKVADKLADLDKKHETDRKSRAEANRNKLKKAHGKRADEPAMQAEFARHAWRVARLSRLIELAEASERVESVERARLLLQQEETHHANRLLKLSQNPGMEGTAGPDKARGIAVGEPSPNATAPSKEPKVKAEKAAPPGKPVAAPKEVTP